MRTFLTGGTGFIGRALVAALVEDGHDCIVVSRSGRDPWARPGVRVVRGDPSDPGDWQAEVDGAEAVVNLAGEALVDPPHRWTAERKRRIRESRVATTRRVVEAILSAARPPRVLASASAVGYYGDRGDDVLDESSPPARDFLGRVCVDWEAAAQGAEGAVRVVLLRTGMVLGREGGALAPLLPLFRLGLGGPWGSGTQWWPWIHLADEVGLIRFALERDSVRGPLNLAAPHPVTVDDFAKALGRALHRPAFLRAPAFALRVALGEAADALLLSQRVVPRRAEELGYRFRFPEISQALEEIVGD